MYTLRDNRQDGGSKDDEPYRNLRMVVGKDLEEDQTVIKSETESEFNTSRTSFRIKSKRGNRKRSIMGSRNRSRKKIVPGKGAKLGKIRLKGQSSRNLKHKKIPPVDLAEHFMKKFNPRNTDLQKIQPKKSVQKFFTIPFQLFNIVVNEDNAKFETVLPTLENILKRWKIKLEKRMLIQQSDNSNLVDLTKSKKIELESIISEKNESKFQQFFDAISKRKHLNRLCFALYKLFKDTERVKSCLELITQEPKNYLVFFKNISKNSKGVQNSIDRMTLSSAYKHLLTSLKTDSEILKENEYLNYLSLEAFLVSSNKIIELFMISKLHIGLILSKKNHELLKKHCTFWSKVVKSNLLNMANLQKNFEIKFFKDFYKEKLKKVKSTLVKITEFCSIVLRILEFLGQDKEKIKEQIKEIRQIVTGIPKGVNLLEEKNVTMWDTIVVRIIFQFLNKF